MDIEFLQRPLVTLSGTVITPLSLGTFTLGVIGVLLGALLVSRLAARLLKQTTLLAEGERYTVTRLIYFVLLTFGLLACLEGLGVRASKTFLTLGGTGISLFSLATFLALTAFVVMGSQFAGRWVDQRGLQRTNFDEGLRYAIGRIIYYILLATGLIAALQTIGVQLGSLTVLLGALGVGIGFGLQNIVNNFVSGLILLIERPVKVGDWVDLDGTSGRVSNIGSRSTTVVTADAITIIIPNGDCLANQIVNWSYGDRKIRMRFPIGVAYGSDMDKVTEALMQVAARHDSVLTTPPPKVLFDSFGDSSLNLELGVWVVVGSIGKQQLKSDLNFDIDRTFRQLDIEIPFPQHDLNFSRAVPLELVRPETVVSDTMEEAGT